MPVSRLAPCVITASAIEQKEGGIWIWIWNWNCNWNWNQIVMRLTKATTRILTDMMH